MLLRLCKRLAEVLTWSLIKPRANSVTPSKLAAIVIPLSARAEFLPDEQISLRHVQHYLAEYDKYLIAPQGFQIRVDGFETIEFSRKYFGSMLAYNRLMYLPRLYELFSDYKYILMYHLDSLVFSGELDTWCATDVDYIGAPWLPCSDTPWVKEPAVGNGGFALMKTSRILEVLYARYQKQPLSFWKDLLARNLARHATFLENPQTTSRYLGLFRPIQRLWDCAKKSETNQVYNDMFWGFQAKWYVPDFRIPDWRTALQFAFEGAPQKCYEMNGFQLPFGCHAFGKFDRKFWEPFFLPAEEVVKAS